MKIEKISDIISRAKKKDNMITYNSTYVKKLSKDVGEVEKVF